MNLIALLSAIGAASAASGAGVVNLDIVGKRTNEHPIGRYGENALYNQLGSSDLDFVRRDTSETVSVALENQFTYYEIDVQVGTPGQKVGPVIDTGSSDFWVISSNNPYCANNQRELDSGFIDCSTGTFNYNDSSTFQFNRSDDFSIVYGDNTFAQGQWGTDVVTIGSIKLNNCSVAIGLEANSSQSVLGIGFTGLESTNNSPQPESPSSPFQSGGFDEPANSQQQPFTYQNIPAQIQAQGLIQTVAYSLWLNDVNAASGQLLFGGVDHDKYQGTLYSVPIISDIAQLSQPIEFTIVLSGVSLIDGNGNSEPIMSGAVPALLDSGTSFTYLPQDVAQGIYTALGAEYQSSVGGYYVTGCSAGNGDASIVYNFSGANITVQLSELLFELTDSQGQPVTFKNGEPTCVVGVFPTSPDNIILGDSFLRSAYVVYDLHNFEISIANTQYNASSSNVEAIGSNGVPSAVKAPNYSATQLASSIAINTPTGTFAQATGGPLNTGATSAAASSSATGTSGSSSTGSSSKSSSSALAVPVIASAFAFTISLVMCIA